MRKVHVLYIHINNKIHEFKNNVNWENNENNVNTIEKLHIPFNLFLRNLV